MNPPTNTWRYRRSEIFCLRKSYIQYRPGAKVEITIVDESTQYFYLEYGSKFLISILSNMLQSMHISIRHLRFFTIYISYKTTFFQNYILRLSLGRFL